MASKVETFGEQLAASVKTLATNNATCSKSVKRNAVILWCGDVETRKASALPAIADPFMVADDFHKALCALSRSKLGKEYSKDKDKKRAADNANYALKEARSIAHEIKAFNLMPNGNEMADLNAWYDKTIKLYATRKAELAEERAALSKVTEEATTEANKADDASAPATPGTGISLDDVLAFIGLTEDRATLAKIVEVARARDFTLDAIADDAAAKAA